jgi:hypothetical protein
MFLDHPRVTLTFLRGSLLFIPLFVLILTPTLRAERAPIGNPESGTSGACIGNPEGGTSGASVSGFVRDSATGETLVGATVRIKGTTAGTVSNKSGYYVLSGLAAGSYTLQFQYLGYRRREASFVLREGDSRKLNVLLVPEAIEGGEVLVEADRRESERDPTIAHITIAPEQIQQLRIGGEADVFRAIQFIPGILASSQISSGLYVRGGSPDQTLVLLDGATVYNPSHLFGFFSTFNTDAIKDVDLIKGGYPAEYGGRLSAVLDLVQKDGNQNAIAGLVSLGLISSRASLEGPLGNGSWFVSGRRTYIDAVTSLMETPEEPLPDYYFYDLNAKVSQQLGASDKVFASAFTSRDAMTVANNAGMEGEMGVGNVLAAARWTHLFGDNAFSVFNLTWSRYGNEFRSSQSGWETRVENGIRDLTLKGNLEWTLSPEFTVKTGVEASRYTFNYLMNFTGDADSAIAEGSRETGRMNLEASDVVAAGFAQGKLLVHEKLTLQAGLRANYYDHRGIAKLDPRCSLRYQLRPDLAITASWGVFHQYFHLASMPDFSFFDTWLPTDSTVNPGHSVQYALGADIASLEGYSLSVESYYKRMYHVSEMNMFASTGRDVRDFFYDGEGEAFGFEIFLQKKSGRLTGWAGYALGFINARFGEINEGRWFHPRWDRRHDLKIVGRYELSDRWDVGASFTFQSGQAYTGMTSRVRSDLPGDNVGVNITFPAERYALRLPPSHQLNVSVNYHSTLFGLPLTVLLDVYNVYSRRDIWFRQYDVRGEVATVRDVRLLPILPSVAVELQF